MEKIKNLNMDKCYKIVLKNYNGCSEYLLTDINDSDDIYFILKEEEITNI